MAEADGEWFYRQFRVSDFVEQTNEFQIRFIAADEGSNTVVEAAVDGIELRLIGCSDNPDLDGDGDVDAADLAILLGAWGPGRNGRLSRGFVLGRH